MDGTVGGKKLGEIPAISRFSSNGFVASPSHALTYYAYNMKRI